MLRLLIFLTFMHIGQAKASPVFGLENELRHNTSIVSDSFCGSLGLLPPIGLSAVIYNSDTHRSTEEAQILGVTLLGSLISSYGLVAWGVCETQVSAAWTRNLAARLRELCTTQACTFSEESHISSHLSSAKPAYRVTYPDGWYFQISADISAVEVQTTPTSAADFARREALLDRDLFTTARSIGLRPPRGGVFSGGHINIGFESTFSNNPLLFRNFIVDQLNHSELALGIFHNDPVSARTPMLNGQQRRKIRRIIARFDRGELTTARELATELSKTLNSIRGSIGLNTINSEKYLPNSQRVEIRNHRSQQNAAEISRVTRLYEARIEYLRRLNSPIPLVTEAPTRSIDAQLLAFRAFVTESGLRWDDYAPHLPESYLRRIAKPAAQTNFSLPLDQCFESYSRLYR